MATGFGAAAFLKITGEKKAHAADGQALIQGVLNTAASKTQLRSDVVNEPSLGVFKNSTFRLVNDAIQARTEVFGNAIHGEVSSSNLLAAGVCGESWYPGGVGVVGAAGTSGFPGPPADAAGVGVYGWSSESRTAVKAVATGSGIAVRGQSQSGVAVSGGSPNSVGVFGASDANVGVRGLSYSFVGVVGISTQSNGIYAQNATPLVPALYAENVAGSSPLAGYFQGGVLVNGNLGVFGAKNAIVKLPDGSGVSMYCQESPEPYFEDFGRASLAGGVAQVGLEPEFASLIHAQNYMVFVTPAADCKGLYVSKQDPRGFEVRELQAGTSSVPFTYRVVARRKDIAGKRMERLDPQVMRNVESLKRSAADKLKVPDGVQVPGPPPAGQGGGLR